MTFTSPGTPPRTVDVVRTVGATAELPTGPMTIMAVLAPSSTPVTDDDFDKLASATELSGLGLQRAMVNDATLRKLTTFAKLQTVVLPYAQDASFPGVLLPQRGLRVVNL